MLKVLLSAFACEPGRGSELKIGWQWAKQAARFHQVYVLTDLRRRASIEAALSKDPIPNLHFIYHSLPGWLRMPWPSIAGEYLYGLLWQLTAIPLCRRLHREIVFDLAHHVTIVSYQYPSCLAWLPCPFVWGPVGGCLRAPIAFYPSFGVRGMWYELGRDVFNFLVMRSPLVLWTMWRADCIVPTTEFSRARLPGWAHPKSIVVRGEGVEAGPMPARPQRSHGVRVLYVGRLLHWKGVHLGIQAFAEYLKWDPDAEFTINMDGPDRRRLERLVARLNLSDRVHFDPSTVESVERLYDTHDILLLPSLHDSGSFVALEAMSRGLPVICFESGGPAHSVTDAVGIRVKPVTPRQAVADMTAALRRLGADPGLRRRMGEEGRRRVRESFQWDSKGEFLANLYPEVIAASASGRLGVTDRFMPRRDRRPAGASTRVLVSAFACEPGGGSERSMGWNAVREIARAHEVWVLTFTGHRPAIEAELRERPIESLHFVYVDWPRSLAFMERLRPTNEARIYCWQLLAYRKAVELHRQLQFDVVHHVTYGRYWTPPFVGLLPVPFVWGPVGGGESAPLSLWRGLGWRGVLFETARSLGRRAAEFDPSLRRLARKADLAVATTDESLGRMRALGARRTEVMTNVSLNQGELDWLGAVRTRPDGPIRFLSVGRLLSWKGLHLALQGFARLGDTRSEYWILGSGPAHGRLLRAAQRLGVEHRVRFLSEVPRRALPDILQQCHVLVHPSLHDSGGFACAEAMASGMPVVCLDLGGPAQLVSSECGFKVPVSREASLVEGLTAAMSRLIAEPVLRHQMGQAARVRARSEFDASRRSQQFSRWYADVCPVDLRETPEYTVSDQVVATASASMMASARTVKEPHAY